MKSLFIIVFIVTSASLAQELNCRVEVNYENVPVRNRELLADFASVIESYMNTNKFTDENWDAKIDCSLSIFFYPLAVILITRRR